MLSQSIKKRFFQAISGFFTLLKNKTDFLINYKKSGSLSFFVVITILY